MYRVISRENDEAWRCDGDFATLYDAMYAARQLSKTRWVIVRRHDNTGTTLIHEECRGHVYFPRRSS